jgi:AraC-like DNA-binding protein
MRLIKKQIDYPFLGKVLARQVSIPCFDEQWHSHPELELIYIIKSRGVRFLGDSIADFFDDELVLAGPNLPHLWRNDPQYYLNKKKNRVELIIVQFREDFLGGNFLQTNEASKINQLIQLSKRGIKFTGNEKNKAVKLIRKLPEKDGITQLIDLLSILNILSKVKNPQLISSPFFQIPMRSFENDRINNVTRYLVEHFSENISLEKVSDIAHMSPTAFCRYFKKCTNRTFIEFLNEIRISYSCKIIMNGEMKISEISLICGFQSLTLFNRQFRKIMKMSPMEYRNLHLR